MFSPSGGPVCKSSHVNTDDFGCCLALHLWLNLYLFSRISYIWHICINFESIVLSNAGLYKLALIVVTDDLVESCHVEQRIAATAYSYRQHAQSGRKFNTAFSISITFIAVLYSKENTRCDV